jgi:hypothetical protein
MLMQDLGHFQEQDQRIQLTLHYGSFHPRPGADFVQILLLDDVLQKRPRRSETLDDAVHETLQKNENVDFRNTTFQRLRNKTRMLTS